MQFQLKRQITTASHDCRGLGQNVHVCTSWPVQLVRHQDLPTPYSRACKQTSSTAASIRKTSANDSTFGDGRRLLVTASAAAVSAGTQRLQMGTCKRCRQRFNLLDNNSSSCRYHPALYSGGEVAKAIGFVRVSDAPEHQLEQVMGRKGLMRFWDCCGSEDEQAPGCCYGFHITFDDELNESNGWR